MKLQYLSKREIKEISKKMSEEGFEFTPEKEIIADDSSRILIGNGIMIEVEGMYYPFISDKRAQALPEVAVDDGAVKHIANGASVMRPGVISVDDRVRKNKPVKVTNRGQIICVGLSLYDKQELESLDKGVVVKNVHRKGDKYWKLVSEYLSSLRS